MTPTQRAIIATRLASDRQYVFLHGAQINSVSALRSRGLLTPESYGGALQLHHLTPTLIDMFFTGKVAFLEEGHDGDLFLFENRRLLMKFWPTQRDVAERILKGLILLNDSEIKAQRAA